jgi:hypothetical protein
MTGLSPLPVDVSVERVLLQRYDLDALAARIARSIERRAFFSGVAAGAVVFAPLAALGVILVSSSSTPSAPPASSIATSTLDTVAVVAPVVDKVICAAPAPPPGGARCLPAEPTRTSKAPTTATTAKNDEGGERIVARTESRLQRDLAWFARARAAFDEGEWLAAAREARALRDSAPSGALVVEADLLQARALLRAGQRAAAASVASALLQDPSAQDKANELRSILAAAGAPATQSPTARSRDDDDEEEEEEEEEQMRGPR